MKKFTVLFFVIFLISACSPQVTVTLEVTVTLAPPTETSIPTPTLHPEFIEIQNLIADSGERFTLLLDGTIEETAGDGKQIIPNLYVDQNGIVNLIVNNEHVAIGQSQITFDDENGLIIDSYELENGEWVEAGSSIVINGVAFILSDEVDENGFSVVTNWEIDNENLSEEKQAEFLQHFDIAGLGLSDKAVMIYNAETQQLQVVSIDNHSEVIGNWGHGAGEMTWNWLLIEDALFEGGATVWATPIDREAVKTDVRRAAGFASDMHISKGKFIYGFFIFSEDRKTAILGTLRSDMDLHPNEFVDGDINGYIYYLDASGNPRELKVKNFGGEDVQFRNWQ